MSKTELDFGTGLEAAVGEVRAALIDLYAQLGADPQTPQDVARRLGVNKTLTWSISRVIQASTPLEAVGQMPGVSAIQGLLSAAGKQGAPDDALARVRAAAEEVERVIEIHVDDRATLDLVLDGMGQGSTDSLELSRKLAFRGNSGIYGVQAKTRLHTALLIPNKDNPALLDMATIAGYIGFRRLRKDVHWPIFVVRSWSTGNDAITGGWEPLDLSACQEEAAELPPDVIRGFGRGPKPAIKPVKTEEGTDYMLLPGPIGNPGAFDCVRGEMMRAAATRYAQPPDLTGEFGAGITTPSEQLIFDLLVHRDLAFALRPRALVFPRIYPDNEQTPPDGDPTQIPLRAVVSELPGSPPALSSPALPGYAELIEKACTRLGCERGNFRGVRLQLRYPPLNSTVLLRFDLPAKP